VVQSHQHADGTVQGGQRVPDGDTAAHRNLSRLAGEVAQAAHGFPDGAEARKIAIGTGLSITGNPQHDQAGVDGLEHIPTQPPFLHRAGPKVLDQHIALADEPPGDFLALGGPHVEGERLLVARLHLPPKGRAAFDETPLPEGITVKRRLDLDDLGPEFAQGFADKRTGN